MRDQGHQSSISRYFKPDQSNTRPAAAHLPRKRPSSPIDLTVDDDEDNTIQKVIKTNPNSTPRNELLRKGDARRKWALGSEVKPEQASEQDMELRTARRSAYASKLSSHFNARSRKIWEAETESIQESANFPADGGASDLGEDAEFGVDEDNDSPPKGLSAKNKGKANTAVGPFGQTWTPLEKQVGA